MLPVHATLDSRFIEPAVDTNQSLPVTCNALNQCTCHKTHLMQYYL